MQFDIENFYPSITIELIYKSIQFAKEITSISGQDLDINMQSRKIIFLQSRAVGKEGRR